MKILSIVKKAQEKLRGANTKRGKLNKLIQNGDVENVIINLMDLVEEFAPDVYYSSNTIAEADDILKEIDGQI